MPLVGEVEMTAHDYRALVALRASYIPFYCKVLGIVLAVAGLLSLSWSEGYAIPGVLILAGVLVYFAVPRVILDWMARRGFLIVAGLWRYELDDDGVTWAIPSLRITAGWPRVTAVTDHPDVLFLVLDSRVGVVPLLKSAFGEADREALPGLCRERSGR